MKMGLILLSGLMCILLFSGCVASRTGEKAWKVGVVDYYADFSDIKEQTVYEKDGEYFIFVKEIGYRLRPEWVSSMLPPVLIFWGEEKIPVEPRNQYVLLKILPEAKEYLCSETIKNEDDAEFRNKFIWDAQRKEAPKIEVISKFDDEITRSSKHQIVRKVPAPTIPTRVGPGRGPDFVQDSRKLYRERNTAGYFMLPVAVVGYVVDVPATIVMTSGLYLVVGFVGVASVFN